MSRIKTVLNKDLDPAVSVNSVIIANQSGFDFLDNLVDGTGRPLLSPNPVNETEKRYKGRVIVEVPNAQQPDLSSGTITPFLIGDGKEAITVFRRLAGEMTSTNVGGEAWRNDNTEVKYILRQIAKLVDSGAMKLVKVTLPT
jgi:HK97 family phage major capsid protein